MMRTAMISLAEASPSILSALHTSSSANDIDCISSGSNAAPPPRACAGQFRAAPSLIVVGFGRGGLLDRDWIRRRKGISQRVIERFLLVHARKFLAIIFASFGLRIALHFDFSVCAPATHLLPKNQHKIAIRPTQSPLPLCRPSQADNSTPPPRCGAPKGNSSLNESRAHRDHHTSSTAN
jgi:hypothetical protein